MRKFWFCSNIFHWIRWSLFLKKELQKRESVDYIYFLSVGTPLSKLWEVILNPTKAKLESAKIHSSRKRISKASSCVCICSSNENFAKFFNNRSRNISVHFFIPRFKLNCRIEFQAWLQKQNSYRCVLNCWLLWKYFSSTNWNKFLLNLILLSDSVWKTNTREL